ncbi:hypothetical protein PCYB_005800 [Plasmodium cynomolgi strain B]|uniref:CYIR protein n=1 Tax=Plasmodium cynomolgi (strain B) TaxID=1120755 RepID=K6UFB9_PLACD|nr:hypothetical protein PCYB_005800 [Plasmodium cynomolgi strain B]GAB69831.1 hypothetical protein PCYB_005800 [Plasmodium cynomolgi strain B]
MAQCKDGLKTYLNYECYNLLKTKFSISTMGMSGTQNYNNAKEKINRIDKKDRNLEEYDIFFRDITKYLNSGHVIYQAGLNIACNYINYLLNENVSKRNMNLSNPVYEILQDFVREYILSDSGVKEEADLCSSKINPLVYNVYQKMRLLYDLYDEYNTLVEPNKPGNYDPCIILGKIIYDYNESIKLYQTTDTELINNLIDLKLLISEKVLPKNTNCLKI